MWPDNEMVQVVAICALADAVAMAALGLACYRAGDRAGARKVFGWWRRKEEEARAKRRERNRAKRRRRRERRRQVLIEETAPDSPVLRNGRRRCLTCGREEWHDPAKG
jgi:hypothetical protein